MNSNQFIEITAPIVEALEAHIKEKTGLRFSVFIRPNAFCDPSVEFICNDETDELQALVSKMLCITSRDGSYYQKATIDEVLRLLSPKGRPIATDRLDDLAKLINLAQKFSTAINIARQYCNNINYLINNLKEYHYELQGNN